MRISVRAGTRTLLWKRYLQSTPQLELQPVDLRSGTGAHVHAHASGFGDRIHRRPAADNADIKRGFRRRRNPCLREQVDRPSQSNDRIWGTEVAPGVAAGTSHRYFEPPAAESFGDD